MDSYPITIDGQERGRLRVYQRGLFTVFDADAEDTGVPVRLAVYGAGRWGALGVMVPDGKGRVRLTRSLSRAAMRGFPAKIDYAAPLGSEKRAEPAPEPKKEQPAGDGDTLWYEFPDGSLSSFDGKRLLVALPADSPRVPPGAENVVREINGRKYVVFPW